MDRFRVVPAAYVVLRREGVAGWFSLEALPDPVVPHELVVLEALRSGAVPAFFAVGLDEPALPSGPGT